MTWQEAALGIALGLLTDGSAMTAGPRDGDAVVEASAGTAACRNHARDLAPGVARGAKSDPALPGVGLLGEEPWQCEPLDAPPCLAPGVAMYRARFGLSEPPMELTFGLIGGLVRAAIPGGSIPRRG